MGRPCRTLVPLDAEIVPVVDASALVAQPDTLPAPQRSPARQKLADAIATVAALEAEITAAQIVVNDADEAKWKAFATLRDAEEELERAKPQPWGSGLKPREPWTFANQENADAYNAKLNEPPPSIEWAKEAVPRATDARDSALTAVQFHRKRLDTAVGHLQWKRSNIDEVLRLSRIPLIVTRMVCRALIGSGECHGWSIPFGSDVGAARRP